MAELWECPATKELRVSLHSALRRIIGRAHSAYDVLLKTTIGESTVNIHRGEGIAGLLHQVLEKWVEFSEGELEEILQEAQVDTALSRATKLALEVDLQCGPPPGKAFSPTDETEALAGTIATNRIASKQRERQLLQDALKQIEAEKRELLHRQADATRQQKALEQAAQHMA
eukprot:TRINITY_DN6202_c0_g1_i1.p1 TRINITY_DN6202_c0_g1~~TRINITY_DN6202_c0_g1_i1.p1  ORF type:complete len:172 (+),score=28.16 TRINITY_DN6202_c0_g1_i1:142-657(+)